MIKYFLEPRNWDISLKNFIRLVFETSAKLNLYLFIVLLTIILPRNDRVIGRSEDILSYNQFDQGVNSFNNTNLTQNYVYLPLVYQETQPLIDQDAPIWAHNHPPEAHEVVLFRHKFTLNKSLEDAELHIFADTRYEAWIDGTWIGRGPARFSIETREFDVYQLNTMSKGEHLISVLVQWAPNNRRAESTTPYLKAHIQGNTPEGQIITANTNREWKVLLSEAWKRDAVPVHAWGLIGPTELLDLRQLPLDWFELNYDDSSWVMPTIKDISVIDYKPLFVPYIDPSVKSIEDFPTKEIRESTSLDLVDITYRPRSIPFLENVLMPINIIDKGILSPGRMICEVVPGSNDSISFSANKPTPFSLEILSDSPPSNFVLIDRKVLNWQKAVATRPDVYIGTTYLAAGAHKLKFSTIPDDGITFSISTQDIDISTFPFQQGIHAGRRSLLAEPISQSGPISEYPENGLKLTFNNLPGYAVIDLGRTVFGRISAEVSGMSGTIVDIGWDERLLNNTLRPLPYPGSLHPLWNQTDSWVLDNNQRIISTIDARAGRYILIEVWGTGQVTLENIQVHEERYPLTEIGSFSSSDPMLDKIWRIGVNTLYSNLTDSYADPWRERGQWWGDAYVINRSSNLVFGKEELLKRGILFMEEAFSNGRPNALAPNGDGNHMLDYGMLWVSSVADYIQYSGDLLILNDVYPTVIDFLAYLNGYVDIETGLLDIPPGPWSETVYIDTIATDSRRGKSTVVNSMFYGTLLKAADIADFASDAQRAKVWRHRANAIRAGINQYLYNFESHRYFSTIYENEILPPSPHAQAWALAYDVVPTDEIQNVASSLLDLISNDPTSPDYEIYGTFWILSALGRAGFIDQAIDNIKVYYGHLLNNGATTTWEVYNANKDYSQSLSHGWGSSPTWFLTTYLLGVKRTGPNTWEIVPSESAVESVSGSIPLQDGFLQVSWEKNGCQNTLYNVSSPNSSEGVINLSHVQDIKEIKNDGEKIWSVGNDNSEEVVVEFSSMQINLSGGDHNLSIYRDCK
jgi:alpha-L-rhamnosidase